ncbi:hypothetical protein CsatA_002426 [Cannabis sativa]
MAMVICNSEVKIEINFPMEIIESILLRSQAKSVVRFKCVCKSWLSLISNPIFMKNHHKRQVTHTIQAVGRFGGMVCSSHSSKHFDQISSNIFPNDKNKMENPHMAFVGCDHGVVCLVDNFTHVYLWNPAIGNHKKLPESHPLKGICKSQTLFGFGYEPLTNDFKVVAARSCEGNHILLDDRKLWVFQKFFIRGEQIAVYSLKNNSWKSLVMPDLFSIDQHDGDKGDTKLFTSVCYMVSVVVSGSIHWLISFEQRRSSSVEKLGIVAFDLSSEEFKLITPPSTLNDKRIWNTSICNLSGCLSLITTPGPSSCIDIWVMKKYGMSDSWAKYISVDLGNQLVKSFPLGVSQNGNLLLESTSVGELRKGRYTSIYDPKSKTIQHVGKGERGSKPNFATYAESIFLS